MIEFTDITWWEVLMIIGAEIFCYLWGYNVGRYVEKL